MPRYPPYPPYPPFPPFPPVPPYPPYPAYPAEPCHPCAPEAVKSPGAADAEQQPVIHVDGASTGGGASSTLPQDPPSSAGDGNRGNGSRVASFRGVNIAGGEWAYTKGLTPVEGTDYAWVEPADIDYLASAGVRFARLIFSWELLQPALYGAFDAPYEKALRDRVEYSVGKGIRVMIEPHGAEYTRFARYKGELVGSPAVPNDAFADLWSRLAATYRAAPAVIFGLSNEPNHMSTTQWFSAAQAAIDAIRAAGATNVIMVPGNNFSQPESWNENDYDTASSPVSNADEWTTLVDPANNLVVSVHTYFDGDGGGTNTDIVSPTIIADRLRPVVNWARPRGLKVHLTEFGASSEIEGAAAAVSNAIAYMDANRDVVIGWSWWAFGKVDWWGKYQFTLSDNARGRANLALIQAHFEAPPPP